MKSDSASVARDLQSKGIRPSQQRIAIMEYLMQVKTHPSADEVYEALCSQMPTLSKATVYNTLNLFTEKNAVRLVTIDPNERRFDGDMDLHAHFRCSQCGSLLDIPISVDQQQQIFKTIQGHNIITTDVYFGGICLSCQTK